MSSTTGIIQARVGREKQRYDDNFRLVAGCIPYRLKIDVEKIYSNVSYDEFEVLMVSTPNRHDLVFPKGGWEDDESVHEAACREALEEAGVRGILNETSLGMWEFRSKSRQSCSSQVGACRGYMFALEVTEQLESWPEQDTHHRRWVSVSEARELCRYEWMREALSAFLLRIQSAKRPLPFPAMPAVSKPLMQFCSLKPSEIERIDCAINALC